MNRMFTPVPFYNKAITWHYHNEDRMPEKGYYHWHQCCEILLVHQGSGVVTVNNHTYEIKKGMLFIFQPFEMHKVFADQSSDEVYTRTIIHLDSAALAGYLRPFPKRLEWYEHLMRATLAPRAIELSERYQQVDDACKQYDQLKRNGHGHHAEDLTLFVAQLLTIIRQAAALDGISGKQEHRPNRYSEQIMRWIDHHLSDEFDLGQLADQLHLSKFYVSRLFREETGSSITEYLRARRMMQACHLLDTSDLSVEQVGSAIGLANTSHFIHTFRETMGQTPLQYKKSQNDRS
jgi:AraC-like DNA-binding protein